jgi:hypothetical protein
MRLSVECRYFKLLNLKDSIRRILSGETFLILKKRINKKVLKNFGKIITYEKEI